MSRIGKKPITLPGGVNVSVSGRNVAVKGPKGELAWTHPVSSRVEVDTGAKQIRVSRADDSKQSRANHGLTRALIASMIQGVAQGYERRLEIYGTGYNCKLDKGKLHLNVGFSGRRRGIGSQYELAVPKGLEVVVESPTAKSDTEPARLVIRGCDKQKVGQFAAEIRSIRKTEPYQGKGIRYQGERVRRKQGKAVGGK